MPEKTLEQLKDEWDAAEDAAEATRAAHEARAAYHEALKSQERTNY